MRKKILIVTGDPKSVNSEIIFKSWKKLSKNLKKRIYFISNYKLLSSQFKKLKYKIKLIKVNNLNEKDNDYRFKIINIDLKFKEAFNVEKKNSSKFVIKSLNLAHKLAYNNNVSGIINCPISKTLLSKTNIGVTEFLSSKCKVKGESEAMIIRNKKLSVCPLTTHTYIKNVSKKISLNKIVNKTITINSWFKKKFKKKPKLAILGLNPHNAEFNNASEEKKIIIPAIRKLKKLKFHVTGPLIADTVFINDYKKFDVIIGMYHDQVLAPFKALYNFNAINVTLGLKYIRVSLDHGIGKDLIGLNKANPESLIKSIIFLDKLNK